MTFYCFGCNLVRSLSFVRFAPINVRVRPIPLYPQSLRLVSERDQVVSDSALNPNQCLLRADDRIVYPRAQPESAFICFNKQKKTFHNPSNSL